MLVLALCLLPVLSSATSSVMPTPAIAGGARTLPLFHIGRSNSKNRVHYAIRVDAKCRPRGEDPIHIYWRMLEKGPNETEGLNVVERLRAYGIDIEKRFEKGVNFRFVAYRERLARVRTSMKDGKCRAETWAPIAGAPAVVDRVFVQVKERRWWQFPEIPWVDVFAHRGNGKKVKERVIPP